MQISCPHCNYSKWVDAGTLPKGPVRAHCPQCQQSFLLPEPVAAVASPASVQAQVTAPELTPRSSTAEQALPAERNLGDTVAALPKAGFWMRVVATLIDAFVVFILQVGLGLLLTLAGFATSGVAEEPGNLFLLVEFFSYALSFAYYIFFTGYCGQTPGKMALRIKVIKRDGSEIGYGRAAFRETLCKFISGIIFGIGYLMVAFDEQKQGLHDRMADTYVIKL